MTDQPHPRLGAVPPRGSARAWGGWCERNPRGGGARSERGRSAARNLQDRTPQRNRKQRNKNKNKNKNKNNDNDGNNNQNSQEEGFFGLGTSVAYAHQNSAIYYIRVMGVNGDVNYVFGPHDKPAILSVTEEDGNDESAVTFIIDYPGWTDNSTSRPRITLLPNPRRIMTRPKTSSMLMVRTPTPAAPLSEARPCPFIPSLSGPATNWIGKAKRSRSNANRIPAITRCSWSPRLPMPNAGDQAPARVVGNRSSG